MNLEIQNMYLIRNKKKNKSKRRYKLLSFIVVGILINGVITIGILHQLNCLKKCKGAVVTNGRECGKIGGDILRDGGSAVDAAIGSLLCEGVAQPENTGIGGGFLMTIYTKKTRKADTLNAREVAPLRAHEQMFNGNPKLSLKGGLAVAVPGQIKGYWAAHKKYGKLPWKRLFEPNVRLCKEGHVVSKRSAEIYAKVKKSILKSPTLKEIFIDHDTNEPWREGHLLKRERLGHTLQLIADNGPDALYDGELSEPFTKDIEREGGIITEADLKLYEAVWNDPIVAELPNGQTLYTMPLPGSGVIMTFILNILGNFLDTSDINEVTNWQRIVEAFKFGYGERTELGDPHFVPGMAELVANLTSPTYASEIRERISDDKTFQDPRHYGAKFTNVKDHGTAHISILAPNGDAVSVTSTINSYFGAGFISPSTGIILNDEMDDFSSSNITNIYNFPPSPANRIVPYKRPLSSKCPSIIVNENGDVRLIVGAAGGSRITTTTTLVTIRTLWFNENLRTAIASARLYHQLIPMKVSYEPHFDKEILDGLERIGHELHPPKIDDDFAYATAIAVNNEGEIEASYDPRRGGSIDKVYQIKN